MVDPSLNHQLRIGTSRQVRECLTKALQTTDSAALTHHLLQSIQSGAVPPSVFNTYLVSVSRRDVDCIVAGLRQTHSASVRLAAINSLGTNCRSSTKFRPTWDAVGGADGLASLMRDFSVLEVKRVCFLLGNDGSSSIDEVTERQREMSSLLRLLCDIDLKSNRDPADPHHQKVDPRSRSLRYHYQLLMRACTAEVCMEWDLQNTPHWVHYLRVIWYSAHKGVYRKKVLEDIFDSSTKVVRLEWFQQYFMHDREFGVLVLTRLANDTPDDWKLQDSLSAFIRVLANPVALYLGRRRGPTAESRHRGWNTILACLRRFPTRVFISECSWYLKVAKFWKLSITDGLLCHALKWWSNTRTEEDQVRATSVLQSLVELVPRDAEVSVDDILRLIKKASVRPTRIYTLFRFLIRHFKRYGYDIESLSKVHSTEFNPADWSSVPDFLNKSPAEKDAALRDAVWDIAPHKWTPEESCISKGRQVGRSLMLPSLAIPRTRDPSVAVEWNPEPKTGGGDECQATTIDALIASAMLVIDRAYGSGSDLFATPYPGVEDARFPALHLADEFYQRLKHTSDITYNQQYTEVGLNVGGEQLDTLNKYLASVPVDLLARLASSVISRGRSTFFAEELTRLLIKSDRPSIACPFIRDIMLRFPNTSSWHELLLRTKLLSRLSPSDIVTLVQDILSSIIQSSHHSSQGSPDSGSRIEVDVAKWVARVLLNPLYIDRETALSILSDLVSNSIDADARLAAIRCCIAIAASPYGDDAFRQVIRVLAKEHH